MRHGVSASPSTSLLSAWIFAGVFGRSRSPQAVLEYGVENDGDGEHADDDVQLGGDADRTGAERERQRRAGALQGPTALERHVVVARRTAG